MLPSVEMNPNGLALVARLGEGNLEKISYTYAAAIGLMEVAGILFPYAVQGPAAPLLFAHCVQTTWLNCPFVIPEYGTVAVGGLE